MCPHPAPTPHLLTRPLSLMVYCQRCTKEALERGLAAELTEHLGYDRGEPTSQARGNARNGTTSETVDSSGWGPLRPVVPRDRAGTFTPRPGSAMGQCRLDGLDACESPGLMRRWN